MSKDDHRRRAKADLPAPSWQRRAMIVALLALGIALVLIADRDGITRVIPDLWASAGAVAHLLGSSDWPFG